MSPLSSVNCNKIGSDILSSKRHVSFIGYLYSKVFYRNFRYHTQWQEPKKKFLLQDVPMVDTSNVLCYRLLKDLFNIEVSI